jgi:transcriptional regulator with XRE-family HTH domain
MRKRIHPVDVFVGQRIRALRIEQGLSQSAVAAKLGLTFQQLQKYEKGTNRVSASELFQIAEVLGVAVADLFDGVAGFLQRLRGQPEWSHISLES